ncbi:hypothetical protein KBZ21_40340, partial [Streptomyces sp. A73]|nr:hypothetical protein [Streptomyces sp. A73]
RAWLDVLHQLDVHDGAFIRALTREGRLQSRITATERGDHVTGSQAAASVQKPPAAQPATTTGVITTSGHGWKLTDWLGVYAA